MRPILRYVRAALLASGALGFIGIGLFLVSLAVPVRVWRTGELPTMPIPVEPGRPFSITPIRVWIDTDAACGQGRRTDPDDCLAMLLLAQEDGIEIVGVSTVFGNASLRDTDQTTRALMAAMEQDEHHAALVYRGSSEPLAEETPVGTASLRDAHAMLRSALEEGPLTLVALGPLTNIAIALEGRPRLQGNVTRLIAVMGRRKGHVFHPVEGATAHSFLGHGPVFRDFNFTKDEEAAVAVVAMGLPMTLVPYEAARDIKVGPADLDRMVERGGAAAWVAQRTRQWLAYWREDIGREGFYPFDLIAAAYVAQPSLLRCADVSVSVDNDTWVFGWLGFRGLFVVSSEEPASNPIVTGPVTYCPGVAEELEGWLSKHLTEGTAALWRQGRES